jgi:hypothetical protein
LRTGFLHEPTHSPPKDVEQSAAQTIAKIKLFIYTPFKKVNQPNKFLCKPP